MKKKILGIFALLAIISVISINFVYKDKNVLESEIAIKNYKESNSTGQSRWQALQPNKMVTSEKVTDEQNVEYELSYWYFEGKATVTVTIPEDYEEDKIVIAPEIFEKLATKVYKEMYDYDTDNIIFGAIFQAGDRVDLDIVINNLSKYTYNYDKTSFEIFPKKDMTYLEVSDDYSNDGVSEVFNSVEIGKKYHVNRLYNTALQALIPGSSQLKLTDEAIGTALQTKGYENGMADYGQYLLDFYNNKYGTNYTNLDNFPDGIIREILGETDPYLHLNSAYKSVGITYISTTGRYADTPESILKQIKTKTGKEYNSIEEFVVEYYNGVYGTNATRLVDLSNEALDEFFQMQGMEKGGKYIVETNPDVLALSYNYFYNKALAFVFENDKEGKSSSDLYNISEDYSIGEYMRDKSKGDEAIMASAGTLAPNSTKSINNAMLYTSGNYVLNAFINYEFMVDLQFTYSAQKGTVIVKYVDEDGNSLTENVEMEGMIGKEFTTEQKDFEGYEFVKVEPTTKGTYTEEEQVITYVYKQEQGVVAGESETFEDTTKDNGKVLGESKDELPPKTGDTIAFMAIAFLLSLFGMLFTAQRIVARRK